MNYSEKPKISGIDSDTVAEAVPGCRGDIEYRIEHIDEYGGAGDNVITVKSPECTTAMRCHCHDFFEINYVRRGECLNMLEGHSIQMKTGEFVLLHPGTLHSLYIDKNSSVYNIIINAEWMLGLSARFAQDGDISRGFSAFASAAGGNDSYKFAYFNESHRCTQAFQRLINSFETHCRPVYREALLTELLCFASENDSGTTLSEVRGASGGKFKSIYAYMSQNHQSVTLDEICDVFHYTKTYVCKLFKNNTGKSFCSNLTDIRLRKAQILLSSTTLTVEQIVDKTGYFGIEYFYRLFKREYGMTPIEYRQMQAEESRHRYNALNKREHGGNE